MKRFTLGLVCALALGGAFLFRGHIRGAYERVTAPTLPVAAPAAVFVTTTVPVTSTRKTTSSPHEDPRVRKDDSGVGDDSGERRLHLQGRSNLLSDDAINLAVPFLLQSPSQTWEGAYEDACEEAAAAMVNGYYQNTSFHSSEKMDAELQKLFAWEDTTFGQNKDTTAAQSAQLLKEYYGFDRVEVLPYDASVLRDQLTHGRPVIVPTYGKALHNPNYKNGGPIYHHLVVRGFLSDGRFITNDSGTRKGEGYVYDPAIIAAAAHDWNDGDVAHGIPVMIVVYPNAR